MDKLYIICVDDQREVLSAVMKDLQPLARYFMLEEVRICRGMRRSSG